MIAAAILRLAPVWNFVSKRALIVSLFSLQFHVFAFTNPLAGQDPSQLQNNAVPFQLRRDQPQRSEADPSKLIQRAASLDADLNDIATVSADRVCAVGNCGAILFSDDGGRRWKQSRTDSTENLTGVAFWNEDQGIAVGGQIGNYTASSRAVILRTSDGGQSWQSIPSDLPALRGVQVVPHASLTAHQIVVWGDYSPQHKSGVFVSNGAGAGWQPLAMHLGHIQAVAIGKHAGVGDALLAIDSAGRAAIRSIAGSNATTIPVKLQPAVGRRSVRTATYISGQWVIAGDEGLLLESQDAQTWTPAKIANLNLAAQSFCHWRTLSKRGPQQGPSGASTVWLSGFPGSLLLKREGAAWFAVHTRQSIPLQQVHFLDPKRGWAVGTYGKILATRDGGISWYPQRHEGVETSLLACVSDWQHAPWSALAATAWEELNLCAIMNFAEPDPVAEANFLPSQSRQIEAISPKLGVSARNQPCEFFTEHQLAITLLTYRPNIVVCDGKRDLPSHLLSAIHAAAKPSKELEPILKALGLSAWETDKLVRTDPEINTQIYSEQSQRIINRVGLAVENILAPLPPAEIARNQSLRMQTLWSRSGNPATQSSLLGGIKDRPNTRREGKSVNYGNFQLIMARAQRRRTIDSFVRGERTDEAWQKELQFLLTSLPQYELESSLVELAEKLKSPNQRNRYRLVLEQLIEIQPQSDAAKWAMLELLKSGSSMEWQAWDSESPERQVVKPIALSHSPKQSVDSQAGLSPVPEQVSPWSNSPFAKQEPAAAQSLENASATRIATPTDSPAPAVQLASANEPSTSSQRTTQANWFEDFTRFSRLAPEFIHRPDMQLLVYRNLLGEENADGTHRLQALLDAHELVGWQQAASQELLLERNDFQGFRWASFGIRALTRPRLDGVLEEEFWNQAPATQLSALQPKEQESARIHWAYDHQYLYVAARCPRSVAQPPIAANRVRGYDADLSNLDHLELLIDSDRDYSTAIQLAIAEDGQTYDRCLKNPGFNPKWHVAVKDEGSYWTMEMAIGLRSLSKDTKVTGDAWSVSVRRSIPAKGKNTQTTDASESWSKLHSHRRILEGNGLLLFLPPT